MYFIYYRWIGDIFIMTMQLIKLSIIYIIKFKVYNYLFVLNNAFRKRKRKRLSCSSYLCAAILQNFRLLLTILSLSSLLYILFNILMFVYLLLGHIVSDEWIWMMI